MTDKLRFEDLDNMVHEVVLLMNVGDLLKDWNGKSPSGIKYINLIKEHGFNVDSDEELYIYYNSRHLVEKNTPVHVELSELEGIIQNLKEKGYVYS